MLEGQMAAKKVQEDQPWRFWLIGENYEKKTGPEGPVNFLLSQTSY